MTLIDLADVEYAADIRVRDLPGRSHLGVKTLEHRGITLHVVGQELKSDGLR